MDVLISFLSSSKISRPYVGVASLTSLLADLGVTTRRCCGESDSLLAEMNATGAVDVVISGAYLGLS